MSLGCARVNGLGFSSSTSSDERVRPCSLYGYSNDERGSCRVGTSSASRIGKTRSSMEKWGAVVVLEREDGGWVVK